MAHEVVRNIRHWVRGEFRSKSLLPGLIYGLLLGVNEVFFSLSLGSLIFSGDLSPYLSYGVGIALASSAVMLIGVSLTSMIPGVIGSTQDTNVIMGVMAAALASGLTAARAEQRLATILAAIAITTLLTGVFCLLLSYFKLGKLVRFVPYPVVGGFLAGTGWLLLLGSFSVMTDLLLTTQNIPRLLQPDKIVLWVPAVVFALVLFIGLRRIQHFLVMPAILIGTIVLFYLTLLATSTSVQAAIAHHLLLGKLAGSAAWQPFVSGKFIAVNWSAILGQSGNIGVVLLLSAIGLLLNISALELAIRQDIHVDKELRSAGIANVISGLFGGMVGYQTLSLSTLGYRAGARGRLPGLVAGVICAIVLIAGTALLALLPSLILGGLLFFLGLDFLYDWVLTGWRRLSRADYLIVLLILVVIATTNFLIGVGVGLVATVILFVMNYSRIDIVHHAISGAEMRSNVERCAYHRRALVEDLGQHIYILELQGFIFFGTANTLLDRIRARVAETRQPRIRYIILDFCRVNGLDSSAGLSIAKGKQLSEAQGIKLVLTHLSEGLKRQLELGGLSDKDPILSIFPDLDHGLEWCEEQLLDLEQITGLHTPVTLSAQLVDSGFVKAEIAKLKEYLERVIFKTGDYLIRKGEDADTLYFVEMGSVSVWLEMDNKERVRLQTYGLGTAIGEMDLYQKAESTASVIADSPVTAYRLTSQALSEMKEKEPELAATFHEFMARLLSERLAATTRTLEAVLR